MTDEQENPPAFPNLSPHSSGPHIAKRDGMTLRDYFAGQALAGKLASDNPGGIDRGYAAQVAVQAYWVADAMLAERAKGNAND